MQNSLTSGGNTVVPTEVPEPFGPPPVVTAAETKMHETIFKSFTDTAQPRDVIERIYVRRVADAHVVIQRYRKCQTDFILQARKELLDAATNDIIVEAAAAKGKERTEMQAQL